jgi:hypothetical protein
MDEREKAPEGGSHRNAATLLCPFPKPPFIPRTRPGSPRTSATAEPKLESWMPGGKSFFRFGDSALTALDLSFRTADLCLCSPASRRRSFERQG